MVHATRIDKVEMVEDVVDHTTREGLVAYNEGSGQLVEGSAGVGAPSQPINAQGFPQDDRLEPIVVDLGQYVAGDLVGDVVITQTNGMFTVAVSDIVAAGASGYKYRGGSLIGDFYWF